MLPAIIDNLRDIETIATSLTTQGISATVIIRDASRIRGLAQATAAMLEEIERSKQT